MGGGDNQIGGEKFGSFASSLSVVGGLKITQSPMNW